MKKIFFNSLIISFLALLSCDKKLDEVGGVPTTNSNYKSSAYVTTSSAKMALTPQGGETEIVVRLAALSDRDEVITLSLSDYLAQYNKENQVDYKMLPASEIQLYEKGNEANKSNTGRITVSVKKGAISAKVGVRVNTLDEAKFPFNIKYAIPLEITSTSVSQILSNKRSIITFDRSFSTAVAHVKDGYAVKIKLDKDIPTSYEYTVQVHFMFDEWRKYDGTNINQSLISYNKYSRVLPKDIHLSDTHLESGVDNVEVKLKKWHQATYVYSKHKTKIYLDGRLIRTYSTPNLSLKGGTVVSYLNPQMSYSVPHIIRELRVWNKALTEAQINADLVNPIDPKSEGLVAYVPVNSVANGYKDVTSYNNEVQFHQATSTSKINVQDGSQFHKLIPYEEYGIDKWYENVVFPGGELK